MQSIVGSRGLPKWVPSEMGVGGDFGGEIEIWAGRLRWTNSASVFKIPLALECKYTPALRPDNQRQSDRRLTVGASCGFR